MHLYSNVLSLLARDWLLYWNSSALTDADFASLCSNVLSLLARDWFSATILTWCVSQQTSVGALTFLLARGERTRGTRSEYNLFVTLVQKYKYCALTCVRRENEKDKRRESTIYENQPSKLYISWRPHTLVA